MSTVPPLCIYHAHCDDGFGAAYAVWKLFPNVLLHAGKYRERPPDAGGRDVLLVDFSYDADVIASIAQEARTILVLDHHKTAQRELQHLPAPREHSYDPTMLLAQAAAAGHPPVFAYFDQDKSGARLAWEWLHPGTEVPELIQRIEDRDLYRNSPGTAEFSHALRSYPRDLTVWDGLDASVLIADGIPIRRYYEQRLVELAQYAFRDKVGGHDVPVCNTPPWYASDLGHFLCKGEPFAATFFEHGHYVAWSLRSDAGGLDVSEVAKRYNGGGHTRAAGFRITRLRAGVPR